MTLKNLSKCLHICWNLLKFAAASFCIINLQPSIHFSSCFSQGRPPNNESSFGYNKHNTQWHHPYLYNTTSKICWASTPVLPSISVQLRNAHMCTPFTDFNIVVEYSLAWTQTHSPSAPQNLRCQRNIWWWSYNPYIHLFTLGKGVYRYTCKPPGLEWLNYIEHTHHTQ